MSDRIEIKNIPVDVKVHKPKVDGHAPQNLRNRIYVRAVKGLHQLIRRRMGIFFLGLFAILPWIEWNGQQAILFDIVEQKFNIFGLTLWPQDMTIFSSLLILSAFLLFFVTTFYGRVWCGYMCPQTVWTFMFIWFEEKIEGSANKRKKRDSMPMSFSKFWKKTLKHFSWWAVSILTSLTFIGYFVPIDDLFVAFFTFESSATVTGWTLFFAAATYGNAGWMREIMCLHICPYARFQSAMFDKDTYTVAYDATRGEKRGARSKKMPKSEHGLGDCIDCNLCVQVCPTGIDIRNGLQYECINCGACIDACNQTMDKMKYPRDLISYTTEHSLEGKPTDKFRGKLVGYLGVCVLMTVAFIWQVSTRVPLEVNIERDRTVLYRTNSDNLIENTFTLQVLNKGQVDHDYVIEVEGLDSPVFYGKQAITVKAGEAFKHPISIAVEPDQLTRPVTNITIIVRSKDGEFEVSEESRFFKGR
jgi:cytochrome c oxidase accessory protein FixG